jgi:hypothetical protein
MRIGQDDNYLLIECSSPLGGYSTCRLEAVAAAGGGRFTAVHDRLMMDASGQTGQQFSEFADLKTAAIEIRLTEGGWLRLERDHRGYITVRYRIAGWRAAAAMEGEALIEGEYAGSFCREFGAFLKSSS